MIREPPVRIVAHGGKEERSVEIPCTGGPTGAGEGIRTLDPNLGKVVLYPLSLHPHPRRVIGRPHLAEAIAEPP